MQNSQRFAELIAQIERLQSDLLPSCWKAFSDYSPAEVTRTIAFRVLAHAEFEAYLEDRAREAAIAAVTAWNSGRIVRRALISLFAFAGRELELPPQTLTAPQPTQEKLWPEKLRLEERIRLIVSSFVKSLVNNHGVKEENLLAVLVPVGVDPSKLDPLWVEEMNTFGRSRGQAAHNSLSGKAFQQPDPKNELELVKRLLVGLEKIDREIEELCK